eukprot:3851566-Alexandrium_andersonii.AAC.1
MQSSSAIASSPRGTSGRARGLRPGGRGQPSGRVSTCPRPARTLYMTKSSVVDWKPPEAEAS